MDTNKTSFKPFIYSIFFLLLILEYIFLTRGLEWKFHRLIYQSTIVGIYDFIHIRLRFLLVLILWIETTFDLWKEKPKLLKYTLLHITLSIPFLYIHNFNDYINMICYPSLFIAIFFMNVLIKTKKAAKIEETNTKELDFMLDDNFKPTTYSIHWKFDVGWLNIDNPFKGFEIVGGAGSGKTYAILEIMMLQMIMKGFVLFNYDFKFSNLTTELQKYLDFREIAGHKNYPHYIINFTDPLRTNRFNAIHPDNIENDLELASIATVFIQNIKKEWVERMDFWADAGSAWLNAIMYYLYKNEPTKCSFAHVIEMCTLDYNIVLSILSSDPEAQRIIVSYMTAKKNNAGQQLAGMAGTLQVFMPKLRNPNIYWVLTGNDFTLDLNNPKNPKHLSLGNTPGLEQEYLKPIIGCISRIAMDKMNRDYTNLQQSQGIQDPLDKIPAAFNFDELATTFIDNLDQAPNVGRSHLLATSIGIQLYPQLLDKYGQKKYEVLTGSFGNKFVGLVNDSKTAESVSKLFGQKKVKVESVSVNTDSKGNKSTNQSYTYQDKQAVPIAELTTQRTGHFIGKYTLDFEQDPDTNEPKPFFKGTVQTKQIKKLSRLSKAQMNDPELWATAKLTYPYKLPEFVKFSDSHDFEEKEKDMKNIINKNFKKVGEDINEIIKEHNRMKELDEINKMMEKEKMENSEETPQKKELGLDKTLKVKVHTHITDESAPIKQILNDEDYINEEEEVKDPEFESDSDENEEFPPDYLSS